MPTNSPLYNFIDDFTAEELSQYRLEKKEANEKGKEKDKDKETGNKRFYYLLHLEQNNPILPSPYNSYELKDTHFSIDELYYANFRENIQDGKTPIHYTQIYTLEGHEDIIVHVFLDEDGEYLYYKISDEVKLTNDQKSALEQKLKENLQDASPILKTLIAKLKARSAELKNQADSLDIELTRLSCNYKKNRQEYITKAYQFIELIEQLNRYSVKQDGRGDCMASMIVNLKAILSYQQSKTFESKSSNNNSNHADKTIDTSDATQSEPKEIELSPKQKIVELYKTVFQNIQKQFEAFKLATQESEKNIIAKNIQDQIFLIYNFGNEITPKKDTKKIESIEKALAVFKSDQIEKLKELGLKGNFVEFKNQYTYCSDSIKPEFYELLINNLIHNDWTPDQEKNLFEILDYLYDVDPNYKQFVKETSQKKNYKATSEMVNTLKQETNNFQHKKNFEKGTISLLLLIYSKNKLRLFEKLLDHGADPKTWGQQLSSLRYFSLFYSIVLYPSKEYLSYLKILLNHGANPNDAYTQDSLNKDHQETLQAKIKITKDNNKKKYDIKVRDNLEFSINLLGYQSGIEGVQLVADKTPLDILIFHRNYITNNAQKLAQVLIPHHTFDSIFSNSYEAAINLAHDFREQTTSVGVRYPAYILYPKSNEAEIIEGSRKIHEIIQYINTILVKRISELTPKQFKKTYEYIFEDAEMLASNTAISDAEMRKMRAYGRILGCEFLLMEYAKLKFDCPRQRKEFVENYTTKLYDKIIELLHNRETMANKESYINFYTTIRSSFKVKNLPVKPAPDAILVKRLQASEPEITAKPKTSPAHSTDGPPPNLERKRSYSP